MTRKDTTKNEKKEDQEEEGDGGEMDSADEALLSMLGLEDLNVKMGDEDEEAKDQEFPSSLNRNEIGLDDCLSRLHEQRTAITTSLSGCYQQNGVCVFPIKIPSQMMRRLTDELVWGGDQVRVDKTYETIKVWKEGEIMERRVLTRMENFVTYHSGWKELCYGLIQKCVSMLVGEEMILFKEKLNLKPPGGSGFAPHLDGPSLRVALSSSSSSLSSPKQQEEGPKSFLTVMIAIDNMTSQNGCLRVVKGPWTEENSIETIEPERDGNPDAGGRAGAIPTSLAETLQFEDLCCDGGSIAVFSEWTPHRSAANISPFPRRAVFLTYNPASQGDYHTKYYEKMDSLRNEWRNRIGLNKNKNNHRQWEEEEEDRQKDLDAFATVPS